MKDISLEWKVHVFLLYRLNDIIVDARDRQGRCAAHLFSLDQKEESAVIRCVDSDFAC